MVKSFEMKILKIYFGEIIWTKYWGTDLDVLAFFWLFKTSSNDQISRWFCYVPQTIKSHKMLQNVVHPLDYTIQLEEIAMSLFFSQRTIKTFSAQSLLSENEFHPMMELVR